MEPEQQTVTQCFMTVPHSRAGLQREAMLVTLPGHTAGHTAVSVFLRGHPGRARRGNGPWKGTCADRGAFRPPACSPHSATSETHE